MYPKVNCEVFQIIFVTLENGKSSRGPTPGRECNDKVKCIKSYGRGGGAQGSNLGGQAIITSLGDR